MPVFVLMLLLEACGHDARISDKSPVESNPAFSSLNDSIRLFPNDDSLYLRRADRLSQINAHELAYADYKKAWSLHPSRETAFARAANLRILGKETERLALLKTADTQFPADPQIQRLLADAYAVTGSRDLALKQYQEILQRDPKDFETWYEQALLFEQMKDTVSAISSLQKAYALQGVATYGLELAHLYAEQKNAKALDICNFILRQDSGNMLIDPLLIKGIYYANMKFYPQAIVQFDSCIGRDWKTIDAYLEKGMAYYHQQKYNDAINTFHMATTVSNTDPDAYYWLGRCYEATHRKADAISYYQKTLSLDKSFTDAKEAAERLQSGFGDASH
ncbi:MAG: tetratricopeptide repeat protein [Bacteroidota bacterium]|nr:tetratricopeptide repeat protein [Bacteroidota bacterium]